MADSLAIISLAKMTIFKIQPRGAFKLQKPGKLVVLLLAMKNHERQKEAKLPVLH